MMPANRKWEALRVGASVRIARPGGRQWTWLAFAPAVLGTVVLLQLLSRDLTFAGDDWKVLDERSLSLGSLLQPYNEHLSAIPIAILLVLRDAVGLASYVPYLLVLHLLHVAACAGVFAMARSRVPDVAALAIGVAVLLLGAGYENLFWGFQIGAVLSTAAGTWALVVLDRWPDRGWLAAVLLAVSMSSSSFALPFFIAAGLLGLAGRRRSVIAPLALVVVAYAGWYALFHSTSPGLCAPAPSLGLVTSSSAVAIATLWYAVGGLLGIGLSLQPAVGIAAMGATLWIVGIALRARRGQPVALPVATLGGILVMGLLIGYSRGCLGPQVSGSSRYVYVCAMLAAVGIAATLPGLRVPRPLPRAAVWLVGATACMLVLTLDVRALVLGHDSFAAGSKQVWSAVEVLERNQDPTCNTSAEPVDDLTSNLLLLPEPPRLRALIARYGSPLDAGEPPPSEQWPEVYAAVERVVCPPQQ